jgi:hypothetical protein
MVRSTHLLPLGAGSVAVAHAQAPGWQPDVTQQQTYTLHHASSTDPAGTNADFVPWHRAQRTPSWMQTDRV